MERISEKRKHMRTGGTSRKLQEDYQKIRIPIGGEEHNYQELRFSEITSLGAGATKPSPAKTGSKASQLISLREIFRVKIASVLSVDWAIRFSLLIFIFWMRQTVYLSARVCASFYTCCLRVMRVCSLDNRCNCIHRSCFLVFRFFLVSRVTRWAVSYFMLM